MTKGKKGLTLGNALNNISNNQLAQLLYTLLVIVAFLIGYLLARVQGTQVITANINPTTAGVGDGGQNLTSAPALPTEKPKEGHLPPLGDKNAKVTIIEFADFQCPFCGKFFQEGLAQVIKDYVNTGKAKLYYRHFAFLGQESNWSAEASECANDQGKFWEYHDYLFNNQQGKNQGTFTKDNLKKFAVTLGLDSDKFNQCLDSGKYTAAVQKDTDEGRTAGVKGTPSTFVDGTISVGAQPYSEIKKLIDARLK